MSNSTPTSIRLRELQRIHEDRAADTSRPFAELQEARDTAAALAELHHLRGKLLPLMEPMDE